MTLTLYRIAASVLSPLIRVWLHLRIRKGKEDPGRLHERFGRANRPRPHGELVWIHAASVGESNSIIPLLELLNATKPDLHLLITTGTVTSARTLDSRLPANAIHQFVPVDAPAAVRRFLDHWQPDAAIWVESEFWPNLMLETRARDIPMALINARMSDQSYHQWDRFNDSFMQLMDCFGVAFAGSHDDLDKYHLLGMSIMDYIGNLKYDAPALPVDASAIAALQAAINGRPIWLAASTHPGEEAIVAEIHEELKGCTTDLLTIIVPRHAHRGAVVAQELRSQKLNVACRSLQQLPDDTTDIYLADTMGELGLFYRLANIVFVGGSLLPFGGHNPIEPAQLGCAVICGPYVDNFRGICTELAEADALIMVSDEDTLRMLIAYWIANPNYPQEHAEKGLDAAAKHTGTAAQLVQHILAMITPSSTVSEVPQASAAS